jgi:hypothetical protein
MNRAKPIASLFCVLLAACSSTQRPPPGGTEELARLVLVIRELPDGQLTHSWQSAEDFELSPYSAPLSRHNAAPGIRLASSGERDCHAEYMECHRECKSSPLPPHYRHIPRGSVRHDSYCWEKCKQPYLDCEKLKELQPREFTALDNALDWLKRNRKTVLAGSLVVIAGVVFVVVSAGAGLVVLAPAVIVASAPGTLPQPTGVSP